MTTDIVDYADIAARYRRMRNVCTRINQGMTNRVGKEGLEATARKLDMMHKGVLVFDSESEAAVLFDQAIHGYFTGGMNAVDRYIAQNPPAPGSDEEMVLGAARRSFYSLFQVVGRVRRAGVRARDILRDRMHFVADMGFSQTADVGMVLATRVLPFDDFVMTGGAALPVGGEALARILRLPALKRPAEEIDAMPREQMAEVSASIICLCLQDRDSRRIAYAPAGGGPPRDTTLTAQPRTGRNDPCPCGSGKKYKKCCGT